MSRTDDDFIIRKRLSITIEDRDEPPSPPFPLSPYEAAQQSPDVREHPKTLRRYEQEPAQLSSYLRLWALANALRLAAGLIPGTALRDTVQRQPVELLFLLVALAFMCPSRPLVAGVALAARVATNAAKGPWMGNSQLWATLMDFALLCEVVRAARAAKKLWAPLTASEEAGVVAGCAATVKWQLAIFYFFSGFWKINTSFLNPKYSCASIFTVQPLEYLPDSILFGWPSVKAVAQTIAAVGPAATLVIEAVLPLALHATDPTLIKVGVLAVATFHLVIAATPPPSNVSSFGVTTVTRLFFCMPRAWSVAVEAAAREPLLMLALAVAPALALAAVYDLHAVAPSTVQGTGQDYHLAYYAALCVLAGRACAGPPSKCAPAAEEKKASRWHVGAALFYAMALPILGLQVKGGCLMFSQLKMHGGSNHLLLPTSLLQRGLVDAAPDNAFAGGVVRINSYSLAWVGSPFAEHMGPRTIRVIRDLAGVPGEYVWAAKQTTRDRAAPPPRPFAYTISNLGLRRLLATARSQGEALDVYYERLAGAVGDETWRTATPGTAYRVRLAADGSVSCGTGAFYLSSCGDRELALLAPPSQPSRALAFMLLPQPNPIVPGMTDEMHCVTWG